MRMTRAMTYRGPDEEGFFADPHVTLGHRRLSIIDLSTGQQPMHSARGNCSLVFNGEIYNFQELRVQLEAYGYPFKTKSDTEVILAGYERWGRRVVEKLRGMFAFALYDRDRRCLLAARDPIGKKPLYFYHGRDGSLYFASDLQALCASGVLDRTISLEALQLYFTLGYVPAPRSIYENVNKLEAGHAFLYSSQDFKKWQYWDIDLEATVPAEEKTCLDRLEELLDGAVARRLVADVPLGALLSGGIDSNLVVSSMCRLSNDPVKTYTAGFGEPNRMTGVRDERRLAALAAEKYGASHEEIKISSNVGSMVPDLIPYQGEPLADSSIIPTYLVCQAARQKVTVALTGDGGDEPFGGYSFRYVPHLVEQAIRKIMPAAALSPIARLLAGVWPAGPSVPRYLRLQTIMRNLAVSPLESFLMDQAIWNGKTSPLNDDLNRGRDLALQIVGDLYAKGDGRDELTRILYVDAKLYMAEDVLVKADRMSMANSLELRSPLLDQEIVSFAFSLPGELKIDSGRCKFLLKRLAERRVPPHILGQPKTGFSIPIEHYMRNEWRPVLLEQVLGPNSRLKEFVRLDRLQKMWKPFLNGDNRHLQFLWASYVLVLWFTGFHERQTFRS
jgi:asparagine synthase (glutamine-hydrolysing)